MAVDIWTQCDGKNSITPLNETAWRMVEEIIATRKLVDSYEEQLILEEIIESSRTPIAKEYLAFHPLLTSSFRNPPLKYGSRFSRKSEPSLWYGSLQLSTAMSEKAFYQFNFLRASKAKFGIVEQPLTAYSAQVKTNNGIKFLERPFVEYAPLISSPDSYEISQALGLAMREADVHAFIYQSARDTKKRANIALFTPKAFLHKKPDVRSFQSWQCIANDHLIEFIQTNSMSAEVRSFSIDQFMINGVLPFPAN